MCTTCRLLDRNGTLVPGVILYSDDAAIVEYVTTDLLHVGAKGLTFPLSAGLSESSMQARACTWPQDALRLRVYTSPRWIVRWTQPATLAVLGDSCSLTKPVAARRRLNA